MDQPDGVAAFNQGQFKTVMSRFATGVTIVTAIEESVPVGFTCQSFLSLSMDPPLVALAPAKTSTSWPRIRRAGAFCVNVLSDSQTDLCRAFSLSGADKFEGVDWRPGTSGAPVLAGSLAWIECELQLAHDAGDHELVIGRLISLGVGSGSPLIFYGSSFVSLRGVGD
jgi:flavin reductase (DIM6/NTAB) family NADH-FMN oxidoreductase RutF